ncbi:DVU_1553 family AMP-dependent CoA ligase [Nitratidesulfovibrio liaohensis]|uniref:AMP-binding protein n=1 Tax=Nitratidesulfovibrio liaohensis TaxID=2604158 RepID=A0ABY9R366_9BACT|nr:AMP-binding protein [Nitratidesulfovibrio liaohensis]WMW66201.1 AMP-binding protein [Nitratidesulfovibrio liaohensis]
MTRNIASPASPEDGVVAPCPACAASAEQGGYGEQGRHGALVGAPRPAPTTQDVARSPLDPWLAARLSIPLDALSPATVRARQVDLLREAVRRALDAPFYRARLAGLPLPRTLDDFACLPFTTADDLREGGDALLRVDDDAVARIVTLPTSGSTGAPKRLRFSDADIERTVDFFAVGMTTLCRPGDVVVIFMPGQRPDSVGDLLDRGLRRAGMQPVLLPPAASGAEHAARLAQTGAQVFVATPTQARAIADAVLAGLAPASRPRACLLSAEATPPETADRVRAALGCEVFDHWGMTETGYGGGVECTAHHGFHLREADIHVEIVHPLTGGPLPDGQTGEVVVTTLAAEAMVLLRYRTGDAAAMLPPPCRCGSPLRRLGPVRGRIRRYGNHWDIITLAKGIRP